MKDKPEVDTYNVTYYLSTYFDKYSTGVIGTILVYDIVHPFPCLLQTYNTNEFK